jgi:hypothetical protein
MKEEVLSVDPQMRLLPQGRTTIRPNRSVEGPTCGLIPMRGSSTASSTGEQLAAISMHSEKIKYVDQHSRLKKKDCLGS